jgi:uncharacterized protein (TIGR02271 family)
MKMKIEVIVAISVASALFMADCATNAQQTDTWGPQPWGPPVFAPGIHMGWQATSPDSVGPVRAPRRAQQTARNGPPGQGAPGVQQTTEVITASGGMETKNQVDIPLHKEEMVVSKKDVSDGGVLIRTTVQTENVSQPVDLRREEYVIERVTASEALDRGLKENGAMIFQGQDIYVPLTREDPVASKRTVVVENVHLSKHTETDRQTVSTPVRSEDVEITEVSAKPSGNYWQEAAPVSATAPGDANSVNLLREEMVVGKTVVDNGGLKVRKIVQTQVASQPVELKREVYTIDRSPVINPQVADADFSQKEIRLDLSREEPVVATRIESTQWFRVHKQVHTDTKTVSGIVRSENIEVVKIPASQPAVGGTSASGQSGTTVVSGSGTSN